MNDLIDRLRALSRHEHGDYSIGDEAADVLEELRAEREAIVAEALKYAGKSGRLEARADRLAEALREAMEWNWIDGDVPETIQDKIRDALRDHDQESK